MIFDSYIRQKQYFLFKNGVKQGGVLSPIFFIVLCCEYAKEYDITFNSKKTVCIKYGSKIKIDEHVSMNGFTVQWSESVRHIGNFVDSTLSDSLDCRYKRSMVFGYVNKLISKLGHLQPHILLLFFGI